MVQTRAREVGGRDRPRRIEERTANVRLRSIRDVLVVDRYRGRPADRAKAQLARGSRYQCVEPEWQGDVTTETHVP